MSVKILKETAAWMAVFKPAGMSVHNEADADLVSALKKLIGTRDIHLINRLDAPVGGIVLIGLESKAAKALHEAFAGRAVSKTYLAVGQAKVEGSLPRVGDNGIWKWSLSKRAESRRDPRGYGPLRVPCTSQWSVLAVKGTEILLKLSPESGRKHQLRRHAALAGWPLVGDIRYGESEQPSHHIELFSYALSFTDPVTKEIETIQAPDPDFMSRF